MSGRASGSSCASRPLPSLKQYKIPLLQQAQYQYLWLEPGYTSKACTTSICGAKNSANTYTAPKIATAARPTSIGNRMLSISFEGMASVTVAIRAIAAERGASPVTA